MNIFSKLKLASRKLYLPTNSKGMIIDVGSGGNPHLWANVTTDMFEDNEQRFTELKFKGLFVWSNAEMLPFKDNCFDYSVSSHVLEHTPYPEKMISELERISKAGYIETPPSWLELVCPYKMHYSRVTQHENKLIFKIKNRYDESLPSNFSDITLHLKKFKKYSEKKLTPFHVNKLYWKEKIDYTVIRDEDYKPYDMMLDIESATEERSFIQSVLKNFFEKVWNRSIKFNELDILCCPQCYGNLTYENDYLKCNNKNFDHKYPKYKGYWDFR